MHPYEDCIRSYPQLTKRILENDPPKISRGYSNELMSFINRCLTKDVIDRPFYINLIEADFYKDHISKEDNLSYMENYFSNYI